MNEQQRAELLATVKDRIVAEEGSPIGPILINPAKRPGIWVVVHCLWAYLGSSFSAAMLTAVLSDWWITERDGELWEEDLEWFERRAHLGKDWEQFELPLFKEERRIRLAHNIQLATTDDPNDFYSK